MKNVFNYVPHWMTLGLRTRQCKKCDTQISKRDIIGIGIRDKAYDNNPAIYAEHKCPKCHWREITVFKHKASVEELCYILLEGIKSQKATEKARQRESQNASTSGISDDEVQSFLDFMNNNESYDEFMKHIKADKFKGFCNEQRKDES